MHRFLFPFLTLIVLSGCLWGERARAASDPESGTTMVYGMFRQAPEGGIVFLSPQEPGVVYMPFDATSIMGSYLNIEVRVRGEIRDSFNKGGKTYRILSVRDIRPLTAEYGSTTTQTGEHFGLPGTETAEIHRYHNKTCYVYDRYAVLETLADYSNGHSLRVLSRTSADTPSAVCENLQGTPLFEIPNGGEFSFAGLSGDTLFVQNGQPEVVHGLMAVNLALHKQTLDATVIPGATVNKGTLRYTEKTAASKSCPAGTMPMRNMALDLAKGKAGTLGTGFCRPDSH